MLTTLLAAEQPPRVARAHPGRRRRPTGPALSGAAPPGRPRSPPRCAPACAGRSRPPADLRQLRLTCPVAYGGPDVPSPARPQRRRHRRGGRLLLASCSAPSRPSAAPATRTSPSTSPPLKLVLIENPGRAARLNHLGVEVASTAEVVAATRRFWPTGLATAVEDGTTCCYALQDKVWVTGPGGERWEVYTVLADAGAELEGKTARRRRWRPAADSRGD